ncbi:MAG: PIG-L family deacetylase [Thaumarchaeota archaeon]|nr:PIG-L family deacetylase [Nitrososphaerota archaeon]
MKVVAVGAHPDDIEFGCFGTLYRHMRQGDSIHEVILTSGELGGDPVTREAEARAAAELIGAEVHFGGFKDGNVRDDHSTIQFIEDVINNPRANIVYTLSSVDRHQDHRYASLATISAARGVDQVYEYEAPSVINTFSPSMYVDVTDGIDVKLEALACHVTQKARTYLEGKAVHGLAEYRAFQGSLHGKKAEAFQVVRVVKRAGAQERL